jgi:LPS sulfotransferase NodH
MKTSRSHVRIFSSAPTFCVSMASSLFYGLGSLCSVGQTLLAFSRIFRAIGQRLSIRPRSDDIYIVSYPRSGTTWLQMILYQLTTDGEMNFRHISEVVPFLERTPVRRRNMEALPSPRIFKTHLRRNQIDTRSGRFIYISRSVYDVAESYYQLYMSYKRHSGSLEHFAAGSNDFDTFLERFRTGRVMYGSWRDHVDGWIHGGDGDNILYLTYEELSRDLEGAVSRLSQFLGLTLSEAAVARVLARSRFSYMKAHEGKFEPTSEIVWENEYVEGAFIRNGEIGRQEIAWTSEQRAKIAKMAASVERCVAVPTSFDYPAPHPRLNDR